MAGRGVEEELLVGLQDPLHAGMAGTVDLEELGGRKSMTGRSIARSTRSGMLVGPGLLKNWRPRGLVFTWAVKAGSGVRKVADD